MSESPVQDTYSIDMAAFQAEFEALDIPSNIDPQLLALWIEREQYEIAHSRRRPAPPAPKKCGRSLIRLFPAYIGISVMCFAVILGLIQQHEPAVTLQMACIAFLFYTIVGMFVGMIAERCVNDSVETLLRDIVKRSTEAGQKQEPV
jgi:hypothetical protein